MWKGEKIYLRQVEFADLQTLLNWENNPENWSVSETNMPFSEEEMIDFIVEQTDYRNNTQLRLMICTNEKNLPVGAIDLFEINKKTGVASVGILIDEDKYRRKGYAFEALELLKKIAVELFEMQYLQCTIHTNNTPSIKLFLKSGFSSTNSKSKNNIIEYRLKLID